MKLADYVTLGRSGLRVSPICLGTMTFGTEWGWGADEVTARAMFDRYVEQGGNFVDTADGYTNGVSEQMVGRFIAERGLRDRIVLATKYTFSQERGNPNAGGNGRKNLHRAIDASLRRLGTDYIDLYWLHAWDTVTPVEEVLSSMDALVRAGKIRHFGLSDVPAWYAARMQTMAQWRGFEPITAFQLEYSLVERTIEREHIPAAQELGIALCPWSPLAGGFLSGKYRREDAGGKAGRLDTAGAIFARFKANDRNWRVLDALIEVARGLGHTPAEVALAWVLARPAVTSTIIGATSMQQLDANLAVLDVTLPDDALARLDKASGLDLVNPYRFFEGEALSRIFGASIRRWRPV